ncbi:hypothetical protein TNCT_321781 [Trichonephila clavata]|uniref:Uncharacterized protein n=1 Tax=Trichonephila clavata TaxID=2740835 RepID=A0A8X6GU97_TRICU|nr:hypothetical protein TNCT_321781 [Trichonephila clavata]
MSKNTVAITFPAEGWTLAFFGCGDEVCSHSIYVLFVSSGNWRIHVLSAAMIHYRNSLSPAEYRFKNASEDWKRCPL